MGECSGDFRFVCGSACAAEARRRLKASLQAALGGAPVRVALIEDAILVASELVTNAVEAACGRGALSWQLRRGELALTVTDDAPGWPLLLRPGRTGTHGWGLRIVRSLSAEMGFRTVEGGKQVWATLKLPGAAVASRPQGVAPRHA